MVDQLKVHFREKIGYAAGDFAFCLYWQMFSMFLLFFYTDIFGISAAAAGTMFLVTRLWDTANDPIMGIIADRTNTRWGKFRPFILFFPVPLAVVGILTFSTPELAPLGKIIWAYVTYGLLMMLYTAVNVPYASLLGVMTDDPDEKTSFASFRTIGAYLGSMFVQGVTVYLVAFFGAGNDKQGYQLTFALYAVLAIILFYLTFRWTIERVKPIKQQTSIKRDFADLLTNVPWLILFVVGVSIMISVSIRGATILYYFKYAVQKETLSALFMLEGSIACIVGMLFLKKITERTGKRAGMMLLLAGYSICSAIFYYIPVSSTVLVFVVYFIISLFFGPMMPLLWSMYADTADYSEWKNGRRATGLIFSASSSSQKLGWTLAGSVTAWILAYFGFEANMKQTPESLFGIRLLMSYIPGVLTAIGIGVCFFYKLDKKVFEKIKIELDKRRAAAQSAG
jgi:GPH family glycoside/pentoside/hexuronide:cation symporter